MIVEHVIPKLCSLTCCCISLPSSGFSLSIRFWKLPFRHKSIDEVQQCVAQEVEAVSNHRVRSPAPPVHMSKWARHCSQMWMGAIYQHWSGVGRSGLAQSWSSSSQRCWMGLRALCRPVKLFYTELGKVFLYGAALHSLAPSWNCKETNTNWHKAERTQLSKISLYAGAFRFPVIGTKRPRAGKI